MGAEHDAGAGMEMRETTRVFLRTVLLSASVAALVAGGDAQAWWSGRAGLGLKPARDPFAISEPWAEATELSALVPGGEYKLYAGRRPVLGLQAAERYGGVLQGLGRGWSSALEAGITPEQWLAPRRYSLAGSLHAAFSEGRGLSLGLKYRLYEPGGAGAFAGSGEPGWMPGMAAFGLGRVLSAGFGPSYQVQLNYQYSAASAFGLVFGRELETFTPSFDLPGNGGRQLTFTGQHWLSPSWALSYDLLSSDPASLWRVQGLRLGIRYRF